MQRFNWQPSADLETLRARAAIFARIRAFFAERNVLEVETPLLSRATVTDLHLHSFETIYRTDDQSPQATLYLQTSPEYAMKRLLAAGSGAIFQLCKAFRNGGEHGRLHNPEFTLLEWYRPGFDHHQLMDEMDALLQSILNAAPAERLSYKELFQQYLNMDPHLCSLAELKAKAQTFDLGEIKDFNQEDKDSWLMLLMSHIIEPQIGQTVPIFIYDFPTTQAALAKIRDDAVPVAERFEVYFKGCELANGFHELTDAAEQRQRFIHDVALRAQANYPAPPIDELFLAALSHGLPACAGVALGIDRLIMLALGKTKLAEILSFSMAEV